MAVSTASWLIERTSWIRGETGGTWRLRRRRRSVSYGCPYFRMATLLRKVSESMTPGAQGRRLGFSKEGWMSLSLQWWLGIQGTSRPKKMIELLE